MKHWSPVEMAMRRAVMLQQATISFPFTVEHIVAMGRSPWRGTDRAPDETLTAELLSEVYRHPVQVWPHPDTTAPVILPARR